MCKKQKKLKLENKELLNFYYRQKNLKTSICFYPKEKCETNGINAHSIQNSKVFDLLESKNHLVGINTRVGENHKPILDYDENISRNYASTFKGLCQRHDSELFSIIDNYEIDINRLDQLFLITYRSILKELHAVINNMNMFQGLYQKMLELNLTENNSNSKAGRTATEAIMIAYETNVYKEDCDAALINEEWSFFDYEAIIINNVNPTVACSQLFSIDSIKFEDNVLRIVLNVFPINKNQTLVLFSFRKQESVLARNYLNQCLNGKSQFQRYEISKMIIRNCENFYIAPKFFQSWSPNKKEKVLKYFKESLLQDLDKNDKEFYLFDEYKL